MAGPARVLIAEARRTIRRWPYTALLLLLVAALFVDPLLGDAAMVQAAQPLVLAALVYGAAEASHARRSVKVLVGALVVLKIAVDVLQTATPPIRMLDFASVATTMAVGLTALLVTVRALFTDRGLGADALAGAAFGYLLLAVVWALVYAQVEIAAPGSFSLPDGEGTVGGQLMYFSLVTLTTLGYGDVTPASPLTRLFAGFEAVQGALYLAIFIGRVLALAHMAPTPVEKAAEEARTRGPSGPVP
jgi:hypothetical protein